jgi:UDPglucose 6-dehydrogenase
MSAEREPIGVIGVGWVGLVTAACFAELGHEVWARDIVAEKVESLARGEVPIHEPGLPELVTKNAERLHFTTEMEPVLDQARLLFVCVDTPPTYSGDADLSRVEAVLNELGDSSEHALVMKSTVPVGTGRSIQRRRPGTGYVSNPEFLKEGTAVEDFLRPDRVVIGADEGSEGYAERVAALYAELNGEPVRTDVASAEMIKLASNAFLATKISFINEIANVSEELGADVTEVARGMGLDDRIGPKFLRAGIGWGGSCLPGDETLLVRRQGRVWLWTLEELWNCLCDEQDLSGLEDGALRPDELEVLSWRPDGDVPEFRPVKAVTRRWYEGDLVEARMKMGRRLRCTPDHPLVVGDGVSSATRIKLAGALTTEDWLPVALGAPAIQPSEGNFDAYIAAVAAEIQPAEVIVRPAAEQLAAVPLGKLRDSIARINPTATRHRPYNIAYTGELRYDEARGLNLELEGARARTIREQTSVPFDFELDEDFWRVAGLYIAEGFCGLDTTGRPQYLQWSFHPTAEEDLAQYVASFWRARGVRVWLSTQRTARLVKVTSRLLASWWNDSLDMGRTCYEKRIPDIAWTEPEPHQRALLSGLWFGDGSWKYVTGGPSVTLEYGTVSGELADGILRLLAQLGLVASLRVGRTTNSTCDAHWLSISGADQVERGMFLVPDREHGPIRRSLGLQRKRMSPTGYRRRGGTAWTRAVRMSRLPFAGPVYSLEVPGPETFVTTAGTVVHNCFGKDVLSLRQMAANTGYHFQLLTAVTEVNDLQKRRTVGKLQKHLGSLVGKQIAMLGIAFKPDTDDIRDATSLVLGARLNAEGARVRAYDPVAAERAREILVGTELSDSALEAIDGADAVVLVTEWPEFRELDWAGEVKRRLNTPVVIDGRNFLDREALIAAGFTYEGIGR